MRCARPRQHNAGRLDPQNGKQKIMLLEARKALVTSLTPPALLMGATWNTWLSLLRDNRYRVDMRFWPRALSTSCVTVFNSLFHWWERRTYETKLEDVKVEAPIFVLGFWRSGTTHLHNLLGIDRRFAFPNGFQVMYPNTFLTAEERISKLVDRFLPQARPMDNLRFDTRTPQEDELALCTMTSLSPCTSWIFPRREDDYGRYLTFRDAPPEDVQRWREALELFLKKLTWKCERRLVLKSPPHTCRIALLRDMFPDARFVHIHRDPYTVFQSTRNMLVRLAPYLRMQTRQRDNLDDLILRLYTIVYDAFTEDVQQVPESHFHEIGFEDLESDPLGSMRTLYERLELPEFQEVEPALVKYLESIKGYKKNRHADLDEGLRQRIAEEWRPYFERWGYAGQ